MNTKYSQERVSHSRTAIVTACSVLLTWAMTALAFLLTPYNPDTFNEIIGPTIIIATLVPITVSIPVTIILQRGRVKLARALRELEEVHEELERRSRIDPLTGILNREALLRQVNQLRVEGAEGAMLMIDIDHFKSINDMYGHLAGDEALRGIAATLAETVRGCDLVGRLGGEEFGAFIPCDDVEIAHDLAERLRLAVARMAFTPQPGVVRRITASIGVATGTPVDTLNDLMKRADRSLYRAKAAGRDQVIVHTAA